MNIQNMIVDLERTIAGKIQLRIATEGLVRSTTYVNGITDPIHAAVAKTTLEYLKVNIGELERIKADLEKCL